VVTFGLDISHHQDLGLDLAAARRDGIEFVFIKATEGGNFVDPEFSANVAEARAAGQLVAAYHYVRADATAADQCRNIDRTVPRDVPVILDVERGSGSVALARAILEWLQRAGRRSPLLYLPRWYWQELGRPSLAGLPPLWSSRYPDNVVGSLADEWADVPASYWEGYGGLSVAVLQFTSSSRVAGHQPLDANAYRGTRETLAALLGYETVIPDKREETDMQTFYVRGQSKPDVYCVTVSGTEVDARHVSPAEWALSDKAGFALVYVTQPQMDAFVAEVVTDDGS
jgi:lysozyme